MLDCKILSLTDPILQSRPLDVGSEVQKDSLAIFTRSHVPNRDKADVSTEVVQSLTNTVWLSHIVVDPGICDLPTRALRTCCNICEQIVCRSWSRNSYLRMPERIVNWIRLETSEKLNPFVHDCFSLLFYVFLCSSIGPFIGSFVAICCRTTTVCMQVRIKEPHVTNTSKLCRGRCGSWGSIEL